MTDPAGPHRPFDAVLCDLDGVIRFFDHSEVARLERSAGLPEGSAARAAFAPEALAPLVLGRFTKPQWVESITSGLASQVPAEDAAALAAAFSEAPFRADEIVVDLLRRTREHCPVLLVTNATAWLDDDLALLGLTDFADSAVNSSRVGSAKPDRRIYEIAAEQAGTTPDRCLFVDDRQENVDTATGLGMTGILYRAPADLHRVLAPLLQSGEPAPA